MVTERDEATCVDAVLERLDAHVISGKLVHCLAHLVTGNGHQGGGSEHAPQDRAIQAVAPRDQQIAPVGRDHQRAHARRQPEQPVARRVVGVHDVGPQPPHDLPCPRHAREVPELRGAGNTEIVHLIWTEGLRTVSACDDVHIVIPVHEEGGPAPRMNRAVMGDKDKAHDTHCASNEVLPNCIGTTRCHYCWRDGSPARELTDGMNVFLVGWSQEGAADLDTALRALEHAAILRAKLGGELRTWRSPDGCVVVAFVHHDSTEIPGARYVHTESDRIALFAGMPFEWRNERETEGLVLDAAVFSTGDLARSTLDGRCAIVRYATATGALEIRTDELGAYPMYVADDSAMTWFGNTPFLIGHAAGKTDVDLEALGSFIGLGWVPAGTTFWRGVERMQRATLEVRRRSGAVTRHDLLPTTAIRDTFGGRPRMSDAPQVLVATIKALGGWHGRPNVVPVSGGRDSRVIFAAAVAAGVDFVPATIAYPHIAGYPETPDVILSGQVVGALGMERIVSRQRPGAASSGPPGSSGRPRTASYLSARRS